MRGSFVRSLALPLAAVLLGAVVVWLRAASPEAAAPPPAGVEEVSRRTEDELRRRGGVYTVTVSADDDLGLIAYRGTIRLWVDVRRDVSREERELGELGRYTTVTTHDARYARERDGRITTTPGRLWRCYGVGVAASALLGCPGPTERSTTTVTSGMHDGRPTIVLLTAGTLSGSDETFTFTRRLHLDPATYLPVAAESDGLVDFGQVRPTRERHTYAGAFLPAGAIPGDHFEPASLGYVAPDLTTVLDGARDLGVYWLGSRWSGERGLSDLVLSRIDVPSPSGPGYRFSLQYAPADDRFAPPVVTLQLWPRAAWDAFLRQSRGGNFWEDPCFRRDELALEAGRAVVFSGVDTGMVRAPAAAPPPAGCPGGPYDRFLAHAFIDDAVVLVDAPSVFRATGRTVSPYNTFDGMAAIVRGLRRR
jgi:hypothetical protein